VAWVSLTYRVSTDELTKVGVDTYLTGGRMHAASRQVVLSDADSDGVVWVVRDQYLRTLTPVASLEHVALIASLEGAGEFAIRVCTRAIDANGAAVACGFLTLSCLTASGDEAALPLGVRQQLKAHGDPTTAAGGASFASRSVAGGAAVASLFSDEVLALGARVAKEAARAAPAIPVAAPRRSTTRSSVVFRASSTIRPTLGFDAAIAQTGARKSGMLGAIPEFATPIIAERGGGLAFVFPGVGGYDGALLRELHAALPYLASHIDDADIAARRHLRASFFALVDADSMAEHDDYLASHPELGPLGAFVSGVLFAEALQERGIRADVLVGHGMGELTALAVAGVFDVSAGLEIIAQLPAGPEKLERTLARLTLRSPRAQVYSTFAGGLLGSGAALPRLLASHVFSEPDFAAAVRGLRRAGCEYFVECGASGLTRVIGEVLSGKPASSAPPTERRSLGAKLTAAANVLAKRAPTSGATPRSGDRAAAPRLGEIAEPYPVAITGIGCILPGARDLDEYWRNVLATKSAITTRERLPSEAWESLADAPDVIASAEVPNIAYSRSLPFTPDEFELLSDTQRVLAIALHQALAQSGGEGARRVRCIIGASGDGMRELEERPLIKGIRRRIATLDEPKSVLEAVSAGLGELAGISADGPTLGPCAIVSTVVERFLGEDADVVLVDAACASSLHAVDLGIKALRTAEVDVVIVGGVFTPGATWQPLHALFEGGVPSGSAPFSRTGEGPVFGEGATLLVLERLKDALEEGRARAVIRAVGLASDGRKSSVSEPSASGSALAVRRAYEIARTPPDAVQFVEGHGAAHPASDAAEIDALQTVFGTSGERPLGSVKALIGHTVWASGAASIAKVCCALQDEIIPPQPVVGDPHQTSESTLPGFFLPSVSRPWPANAGDEPRRAGIDAFAMGGTNAHVIVEGVSPQYHRALADRARTDLPRTPVAVVGFIGIFASSDDNFIMSMPGMPPVILHRTALRSVLPAELHPEVIEQLDVSQLLAAVGADKVLSGLADWQDTRDRIGVVVGMTGRTARGRAATERVYRDHIRDLLAAHAADLGVSQDDAERVSRALHTSIGTKTADVNGHTLMGMLASVAATRVANVFDLRGPSLVIDAGARSIFETMSAAERWLTAGTADVMVTGLLRLDAGATSERDGAMMLALTTPAVAREQHWTILGELAVNDRGMNSLLVRSSHKNRSRVEVIASGRSIAGLDQLAHALAGAAHGKSTVLRWEREQRRADVRTALASDVASVRRPALAAESPV
jgi:acyl transferase domain-containing protein